MRKLLIVDDDIMTLRILKKYLEGTYEVQTESAGYKVVEQAKSGENEIQADMILLDVTMPIMDGITVMEELIRCGVRIPIVFLSGVSDVQVVVEAISKGAIGFVSKSAPKSELLGKLEGFFLQLEKNKEASTGILVLGEHADPVKAACQHLMNAGYRVEGALSVVSAIDYLNEEFDTLVLLEDMFFTPKRDIYTTLAGRVKKNFTVVFGDPQDTESSLIDKVGKAVG